MFLPYASIAFFESVSEGSVLVMSLEMPSRSGTAKTLGAIAGRRPEPEQRTRHVPAIYLSPCVEILGTGTVRRAPIRPYIYDNKDVSK
jgi:hypothetical protein